MTYADITEMIEELEHWNRARQSINRKPDRRTPMRIDTLERTIALLYQVRKELYGI